MEPISIALALAQFAPSIMRFFGAGEASTTVVDKIINTAQTITGASSPSEALVMLKASADKQIEFNIAIINSERQLELAYLSDVQDARKREVEMAKAGAHNYRADSMYVLAVLLIAALVWAVLTSEMDEYAKGIITLVLGRFLGYLDNIYNYEFGTTRVSRTKDSTIESLSKSKDR